MSMTTKQKAAAVNALVGLAQIADAISGPREAAKELTAVLSETFINMYHDAEISELQVKANCEAILNGARKAMNNPKMKEGELASAWRQYKSDTIKAIKMSAENPEIRLTHTTMSALKKFIGTGSTIGQLVEMMQAYTYHVKKGAEVNKPAHLKFADDTLEAAMAAIAAYAEKHAISLVKPPKAAKEGDAPMVAAATAPKALAGLPAAEAA
jgi:hypothetical protein